MRSKRDQGGSTVGGWHRWHRWHPHFERAERLLAFEQVEQRPAPEGGVLHQLVKEQRALVVESNGKRVEPVRVARADK